MIPRAAYNTGWMPDRIIIIMMIIIINNLKSLFLVIVLLALLGKYRFYKNV